MYGQTDPAFTAAYSGLVNGDTEGVLSGSPSLTTTATADSAVGSYPITAAEGTLAATNYIFNFVSGTLKHHPGRPDDRWSTRLRTTDRVVGPMS